jgi:hypothetical protein
MRSNATMSLRLEMPLICCLTFSALLALNKFFDYTHHAFEMYFVGFAEVV